MRRTGMCGWAILIAWLAAGRGAEGDAGGLWGKSHGGLQCRLVLIGDHRVPMGARLEFRLQFHFDPAAAPGVEWLNRFLHPGRVALIFTERTTGRVYERRPDGGVPELPVMPMERDCHPLRRQPRLDERLRVRLLTSAGEQLPPGTYGVLAVYDNGGRPAGHKLPVKGAFWSGGLKAPPIILTVRPAAARVEAVRTHSALTLALDQPGFCISWSEDRPQTLRLTRRLGFFVGLRCRFAGSSLNEPTSRDWMGLASTTWLAGGADVQPSDRVRRFLASGRTFHYKRDVEIFETSVKPGHGWMPERGDFKVLWRGTVAGVLEPPSEQRR